MSADTDNNRSRRRLLLLLLVVVIVLLGAGIGTFTIFDSNGDPDNSGESEPTDQLTDAPTTDQKTQETTGPEHELTESPTDETNGGGTEVPTGEQTDRETESPTDEAPAGSADDDQTTSAEDSTTTDESTATESESSTDTQPTTEEQTDDTGSGDSADEVNVSLGAPDDTTLMNTGSVMPGHSETETLQLTNTGDDAGYLRLAQTTVIDHENGIVEPEAAVDSSPNEGELSTVIEVKMTFQYPDGSARTVVGSEDSFVPLSSMDDSVQPDVAVAPGETVTVELAWRIPDSAGNEIQSDTVTFDAVFELRAE